MDKLVVGILGHVDAGKTTLSEGLLYTCGRLKKLGRVDHQDAFQDTYPMERARGITIFSKQAVLPVDGAELTLLDTPGHADFSSEMERTLQVLDCAILVISGTDGVQGHTHTLWRLLERYGVPTFLFVNKMDLAGADKAALLAGLKAGLDEGCVDFTAPAAERDEAAALCGEDALERYLEDGALDGDTLTALIARRRLFPCWFGSALKLEGVAEFLQGLVAYAPRPRYGPDFAARVFKISRDNQGNRLTWMKLTGGALRVKEALSGPGWTEKADQLRVYSGSRFQTVDEAQAGSVVAVTGLSRTAAGEGLGAEAEALPPALEPVLIYQVLLPEGQDPHAALGKPLLLEEEEHAKARGARILAEVVGYGATCDAYHMTAPRPDGSGAAKAMEMALADGGAKPEDVDYINAHGTSTPLNDAGETAAVKTVFGDHAYKLAISSTKSMTGHMLGAAGAVEAMFCAMALHDGYLPATINYQVPDPACDLDVVPGHGRSADVRYAMSNSLGFGGHNGSLLFKRWEA